MDGTQILTLGLGLQAPWNVVVKCFWPPSFEHSSSSFLPNSAVTHRYVCAA